MYRTYLLYLFRVNTDMIRLYSELSPRFKTLGYIVKHFAKVRALWFFDPIATKYLFSKGRRMVGVIRKSPLARLEKY